MIDNRIRLRTGALLASVTMIVTGCGSDGDATRADAPAGTASAAPNSSAPDSSAPDSSAPDSSAPAGGGDTGDELDPDVDEFVTEFKQVQESLESYWAGKIDGYEKPVRTIVFGGKSDAESTFPTCGGDRVEAENGFYCPTDNTVILDAEWMYDEYKRIGDSFLYVVLAHEYGHSAQANLSSEQQPAESDEEVQADCFSGAYWQEALDSGDFEEEDGDEQEINQTLVSVAGDYGTTDNHGTLAARSGAFEYGRDNGAAGCLSTEDYVR